MDCKHPENSYHFTEDEIKQVYQKLCLFGEGQGYCPMHWAALISACSVILCDKVGIHVEARKIELDESAH